MKSAPSTPAVPTAAETGAAQSQTNASTAADQAALDYVNQYTPYGSTTYNQTGSYTDPSGNTVPQYSQNTSLTPLAQGLLTGSEQVGTSLLPTAQNLANQTATATTNPLNFNTADSGILNSTPQLLDQQAANATYQQQASFLAPQWQQQQQQLQDQLSRQGIGVGSAAYGNAETQFDNSQTQAYQAAADQAISQGTTNATQLFGLAQAGQNQNISQQQLAQQQPLSLLSQLYGATPATPTQPITSPAETPVSPTNLVGATQTANDAAMAAYQAQLGQQNANTGALGGLAAAGITAGAIAL